MEEQTVTLPLMEGEDIDTFLLDLAARMILNLHL